MVRTAGQHDRRTGGRWTLRVGIWLVGLAAVPMFGAGWFALTDVSMVADTRQQAEVVSAAATDLIRVSELQARLLDERNWVSAELGPAELGFPLDFVSGLIGIDIAGQVDEAREQVDALTADLDWPELADQIEAHRSERDITLDDLSVAYGDAITLVAQRSDAALDELLQVAGDMADGADLVQAVRVLDAAVIARQAVTIQLTSYFGAQFASGESAALEFRRLRDERPRYDDALAEIERIAPADSAAASALATLDQSAGVASFREAMEDLLAGPPQQPGEGFVGPAMMSDIDSIATAFRSAAAWVDEHLGLLNAAGDDIIDVNDSIRVAAAVETEASLVRVALLGGASLLFVLGLASAIGQPLRMLARGAADLRDGKPVAMRPSGPREVRDAIEALNKATEHMELASNQAQALAKGELDSPVLAETTPGALGHSLQEAVQTLATSLNQRQALAEQLTHEATHDSLTHLANRSASLAFLEEGLEAVRYSERLLSVSFIDLDGFKLINDHHGHAAGDEVLAVIGRRLVAAAGGDHRVGRLGGDEFVVISSAYGSVSNVEQDANRLIDVLSEPIRLRSATVRVTASIGIAVAEPHRELVDAHELLTNADLALYKAKERGRGVVEICDEDLRSELAHRNATEQALRQAISQDEFVLCYQPIVSAMTGGITAVEALVRWNRPGVGLVSPSDFVPIAERSGLILDIDKAVITLAAAQLRKWSDHPAMRETKVAINVSAGHLLSRSFVNDMLGPLREHGIDPKRVVLEVTESALLQDLDMAAAKLSELRRVGVQIAIDDFGTGYSSLSHLRQLPVDILKIDRSFVADESAMGLVELIIDMGHVLGARVTAEGIEDREQADRLRLLGADRLQGFLYGRPVPPEVVEQQNSRVDQDASGR